MQNSLSVEHLITIEEAINITSGTRKYQKLLTIIIALGCIAVTPMIRTIGFFIQVRDCHYSEYCEGKEFYSRSATYDLSTSEESDEIYILFLNSFLAGRFIGCLVPWLADMYGRKKVIKYCSLLGAFCFTVLALSPTLLIFLISAFLIGVVDTGIRYTSVIICVETIDFKVRNLYIGLIWMSGLSFTIVLKLITELNIYWRYFVLISTCLLLLQFCLMRFIEESP